MVKIPFSLVAVRRRLLVVVLSFTLVRRPWLLSILCLSSQENGLSDSCRRAAMIVWSQSASEIFLWT